MELISISTTSASTSSFPTSTFNIILSEDPIIKHILSYLNTESILQIGLLNKYFYKLSNHKNIWKLLLVYDFNIYINNINIDFNNWKSKPKEYYINQVHRRYMNRVIEQENKNNEIWRQRVEPIKINFIKTILFGEWWFLLQSIPTCILIFTVLVALKLDNLIDCLWSIVFSPLYVMFSILLMYGTIFLYGRLSENNSFYYESEGVMHAYCDLFHNNDDNLFIIRFIISGLSMISPLLMLIFVQLKLDGAIFWSWREVFIPLYFFICISLFYGVVGCLEEGEEQNGDAYIFQLLCHVISIPFIVFLALLVEHLENGMLLAYVFIPLWLYDLFPIATALILHICVCISNDSCDFFEDDILFFLVASIALAPFFVIFKAFLIARDSGSVNWNYLTIFIPLILFLSILVLVAFVFNLVYLHDNLSLLCCCDEKYGDFCDAISVFCSDFCDFFCDSCGDACDCCCDGCDCNSRQNICSPLSDCLCCSNTDSDSDV